MLGGLRRLRILLIGMLACTGVAFTQVQAPSPKSPGTPSAATADTARLLEMGRLLMGQNNPFYANRPQPEVEQALQLLNQSGWCNGDDAKPNFYQSLHSVLVDTLQRHTVSEAANRTLHGAQGTIDQLLHQSPKSKDADKLHALRGLLTAVITQNYFTPEARNAAGQQALRTFQSLVKQSPNNKDGWFWLGIAYTDTLHYSAAKPEGENITGEENYREGVSAFHTAYKLNPMDRDCVCYYGDLLMLRLDFDTARQIWEAYLAKATTDVERKRGYVQAARACLNKAYFGKSNNMPADEVKRLFLSAEVYLKKAVELCPNAEDVKEMQTLLQDQRRVLFGK